MNSFDPPSQGFDKEQPTNTPFRFHQAKKKRSPLQKRLMSLIRHSPLVLVVLVVGLLGIIGWVFASSWTNLKPVLLAQEKTMPAATPTPTQIAAVVATPLPTPTKINTPTPAPPSPTPIATPEPKPSIVEGKRANATAPAMPETGRFTLQIGAYQDQAEAESYIARMKALGLSARIVSVVLPGKGNWHRVQAGRFATREAAMHLGQQLQAQKAITGFVVAPYL